MKRYLNENLRQRALSHGFAGPWQYYLAAGTTRVRICPGKQMCKVARSKHPGVWMEAEDMDQAQDIANAWMRTRDVSLYRLGYV